MNEIWYTYGQPLQETPRKSSTVNPSVLNWFQYFLCRFSLRFSILSAFFLAVCFTYTFSIFSPKLIYTPLCVAGGQRLHPRRVGRRAQALQHRHGAADAAAGAVPGRAHHGPGRLHRQPGHAAAGTVRRRPRPMEACFLCGSLFVW